MSEPRPKPAPDPNTGFGRLFNRDKFRSRALKVYRVAGPIVLCYFSLSLLQSAGLLGGLSMDDAPHWLLVIYALLTYCIAVATPVLFVLASVGGMALRSDWRFSAPLWLFSLASGLFLVTVFMAGALPRADQAQVWTIASVALVVSAAWATVVGYRRRE
jgi:hypothetical protein